MKSDYQVLACIDPEIRADIDKWKADLNMTGEESDRFEMIAMNYIARYKEGQKPNFRGCYEAAKVDFANRFRPGGAKRELPYKH